MTITGIETQHFFQPGSSISQDRNQVTAARSNSDATDRTKERPESRASAPIQDQVTLSKEAQALSASNSQPSKSKEFQESPSPFDR
jgi:hypothetical protein